MTGRRAQIRAGSRKLLLVTCPLAATIYYASESNLASNLSLSSLSLFSLVEREREGVVCVSECFYLQRQILVGERSFRTTDSSLDVEVPIP